MTEFPGIARLNDWTSYSISGENPTGASGGGAQAEEGTGAAAAAGLGKGWKISPSIKIAAGEEKVLADISGAGALQHFWISIKPEWWRSMILRFSWDDAETPAVEVPLGDFFCLGWDEHVAFSSHYVVVAPYCGLNAYWPMPFRKRAKVTLHNITERDAIVYYYLDYGLGEVPADAAYFHAFWNRSDPVDETHMHTVLPSLQDRGTYVGTFLAFGCNGPGWWGEGEFKFFIDGDREFPTICGTGTEDYFGGAWNYDVPGTGYVPYASPFLGLHQIIRPDGLYQSQQRFGMYRWHHYDPVRFRQSLAVTVQDLGWRPGGQRYLRRNDDMASLALWYGASPGGVQGPALDLERMLVRSHPERR